MGVNGKTPTTGELEQNGSMSFCVSHCLMVKATMQHLFSGVLALPLVQLQTMGEVDSPFGVETEWVCPFAFGHWFIESAVTSVSRSRRCGWSVSSVGPLSTPDKQIIVKKQSLNTADTQTAKRTRLTARRPAPESLCLLDGTQRRTGGGRCEGAVRVEAPYF